MESSWLRSSPSVGGRLIKIDRSDAGSDYSRGNDYVPTWKMPISKSYSSALSSSGDKSYTDSLSSGIGSGGDRDNSTTSASSSGTSDPESCPVDLLIRKGRQAEGTDPEEGQVIQILLPCITCNRTFAPDALQRHSKVCTKVNVKSPYKPERGKFDTAEQRKKGTKVEYFIPPPEEEPPQSLSSSSFSRGSKNRSSLRGTNCTTRSTLHVAEPLPTHHQNQVGFGLGPNHPSPLRRQRSMSQTRGERGHSKTPSEYLYDDHSEFGSNSEESHHNPDQDLNAMQHRYPSYAKPITSSDECPYCNRCFGPKAYDRHVQYCKEKCLQRQYEVQPVPKERIEAYERQEIRTKYRPMKGSSSCTSLRSVSPGKDFATMAYKLFGLRRTDGTSNLYTSQLGNFKRSNESIANSCYGDYTRGVRRPSPSPARGGSNFNMANKINNFLSKTFHYQPNNSNHTQPMRVNTTSNIPQLAKSNDNLSYLGPGGGGSHYTHVPSSGYGQQALANINNFNRNVRSRSSLHKNFFRSKRVEPEGTENTGSMTGSNADSSADGSGGMGLSSQSSLIITPMSFYPKSNKTNHPQEMYRSVHNKGTSQDPGYDPYEMAAKQLDELLKAQPINKSVNKKTARKLGLEKAFESVGVHSGTNNPPNSNTKSQNSSSSFYHQNENENVGSRKSNEDPFVFDLASGKMEDSYWDEILQKSNSSSSGGGDGRNEKREQTQMSSASETKSQLSDSSAGIDNTTGKSRALSQISSADSGFSRTHASDGDFEALEMMTRADENNGVSSNPRGPSVGSYTSRLNANPLASMHPSLSNKSSFARKIFSFGNENNNAMKEPESPMQISPSPLTPLSRKDSGESSGGVVGARFCHQCGNSYHSSVSRFCSECGERRIFKS